MNFDASDSSYLNLPDSLPAGVGSLVMRNVGQAAHHAKLVKLNSGVTFDQYAAAVQQGQPTVNLITNLGGNGVLDPGLGGDEVSFDLQRCGLKNCGFMYCRLREGDEQSKLRSLELLPADLMAAISSPATSTPSSVLRGAAAPRDWSAAAVSDSR